MALYTEELEDIDIISAKQDSSYYNLNSLLHSFTNDSLNIENQKQTSINLSWPLDTIGNGLRLLFPTPFNT